MTLNYPHEVSGVPKANAVVGGSIPGCKIATLHDGKLRRGGKLPHVCQKNKNKLERYEKSKLKGEKPNKEIVFTD